MNQLYAIKHQLRVHFPEIIYLLSLSGTVSLFYFRCGNSGVYKTRVMAARALASIITPDQLIETLNSLISTLPQGLEE